MAVLFVYSKAAGPVRWLPALIVPWSVHLERIGQECGDSDRFSEQFEHARDVWGQRERDRPPMLPKAEVTLVRV